MAMNKKLANEIQLRDNVYRKNLKDNPTDSELLVKRIFDSLKLRYRFQKSFWKLTGKYRGYHCIVDFYIPSLRLVIEVDGGYHDTSEQKRKDYFKDNWLRKARKVEVLRIKNEEARDIIEKVNYFLFAEGGKNRKNCHYKYWTNIIIN